MARPISFPAPGCIVEYLESNASQIAFVLEESGGKLRLMLPSRRETKMSATRLLPWSGPQYSPDLSREEIVRHLEEHRVKREQLAASANLMEAWELAQGEVEHAPAEWFAELFESDPDADTVAAYGRALLSCKTHFRFQPPEFLVYDGETAEKKQEEHRIRTEREALAGEGAAFLRFLWEIASKKKELADLSPIPDGLAARIYNMLYARMINPESQEDDAMWLLTSKNLPDVPHLPFQLLTAWGKFPPHHNFWLDRAGYDSGNDWWREHSKEVADLAAIGRGEKEVAETGLREISLPFISIDSAKTKDIDDAFCVEKTENGWLLTIALACPALSWPFGSELDKLISSRATSIYLPEGDLHMLPECLGTDAYSLLAGQSRPAFCLQMKLDENAALAELSPFLAKISLAANLNYIDVEAVLDGGGEETRASSFAEQLHAANELAIKLEENRIANGAIIMERPEASVHLQESGEEPGGIIVRLEPDKRTPAAQRLVSEMMILSSSALADWAHEHGVPLLHRTQNVTVPREYAGIWSHPADLARIIRILVPSILEIEPKPHAALAASRYAPVTSPLRRYTDLINEAQIIAFLRSGSPHWRPDELKTILENLAPALDSSGQVQKFRPRYWKLLYFRQQGDKKWWDGVITEENDNFATVSLPAEGLLVRGRRQLFDERACPGQPVRLRLGKINPLYNEIQILEAIASE